MASLFDLPRPPRDTTSLASCRGVVQLLERAKANGLKWPKLWLQLPDGSPLRITIAGPQSRTPGFLMLTDGESFGQNKYFGRISPAGELEFGRDAGPIRGPLYEIVSRLAIDPAGVASSYGHVTGHCCFCSLKLTDERSVSVGYGKICADRFGLPWGTPPAREAESPDEEPLITRIEEAMRTDEEDRNDQSERLLAIYRSASPKVRQALDDAFVCLCGYSLESLTSIGEES